MKLNSDLLLTAAHLIITLVVIFAYVFLKMSAHNEETFQPLLFIIIGYWFGAGGISVPSNSNNKKGGGDHE